MHMYLSMGTQFDDLLSDQRSEKKIPPSEEGRQPITTPGVQSACGLYSCSTNQRPQPVHVLDAT